MISLITDRSAADVSAGTPKGRYGYTDLNRVESAVGELAALAQTLGFEVALVTKIDWGAPTLFDPTQWPTGEQMTRYLDNVYKVCTIAHTTPGLPTQMGHLDYQSANAIEQALQNAQLRLGGITAAWVYSGAASAGEGVTL